MGKSVAATTLADIHNNNLNAEANITPVHGLDNPERREMWSGEVCVACGTQLYIDPSPGEFEIWLHAWKYSWRSAPMVENEEGKLSEYHSEVPEWGHKDWQATGDIPRNRSWSPDWVHVIGRDADVQDDK
jgi:hypothetical protein